jgi:hypothetical protein
MTQDEFSVEAIRRVPVAEGVLSTLAVLFSEKRMAALYENHRGASYENDLSFHSVVELMYSAVIEHEAGGSEAFKAARAADKIGVSDQAVYGKIRRMRQSLSNALVCELHFRQSVVLVGGLRGCVAAISTTYTGSTVRSSRTLQSVSRKLAV